jgi:hypothetical protein
MKVLKRELFDSVVEINIEATKAWYSKGNHWDCECGYCRNFLEVARKKQLPQLILKLLDNFGILPEQANYVCQIYDDDKGHYYQVSYRLAGLILDEKEPVCIVLPVLTLLNIYHALVNEVIETPTIIIVKMIITLILINLFLFFVDISITSFSSLFFIPLLYPFLSNKFDTLQILL